LGRTQRGIRSNGIDTPNVLCGAGVSAPEFHGRNVHRQVTPHESGVHLGCRSVRPCCYILWPIRRCEFLQGIPGLPAIPDAHIPTMSTGASGAATPLRLNQGIDEITVSSNASALS
jgi:hypothetical protein